MSKLAARLKNLAARLAYLKQHWSVGRRLIEKLPPWITANRVTVGRAFLVIPIMLLVKAGAFWGALTVFVLAMLLDAVDGAIAEVRRQHSTRGAFLDPLADKIVVCLTLYALLGPLPLFLYFFYLPVLFTICLFAVALTLVRVVKMLMFWKRDSRPAEAGGNRPQMTIVKTSDQSPTASGTIYRQAPAYSAGAPSDTATAPGTRGAIVAAKLPGKAKAWAEGVSIALILIGLGADSIAVIWIALPLLVMAAVLGWFSFWSQLKGLLA